MKSVLDVDVSCFLKYDVPNHPKPINLLTWLRSIKYKNQVEQIRQIADKKERDGLKAQLPGITPSGLFSWRASSGLLKHSGLIQFDIDLKENQHIQNFAELKRELSKIQNIAYCGLSVSGLGYWGLIPIFDPTKHAAYFDSIKTDFLTFGIVIDPIVRNVASLRGYSFDPAAYFNHEANIYAKTLQLKTYYYPRMSANADFGFNNECGKVEAYINKIELLRIDLTTNYADWFAIGCAFANSFGENGRTFFHRVSQFYHAYDFNKTDRQFTHCLCGKYNYSLGSFFQITHQYGIIWS